MYFRRVLYKVRFFFKNIQRVAHILLAPGHSVFVLPMPHE